MAPKTKYLFIGDIHGNTSIVTKYGYRYRDHKIVQVGDMGIGFGKNKPPQLPPNCSFIRGNHDNPEVCKLSPHYIEDGSITILPSGAKVMFIGGAYSVDKEYRTPGVDWWPEEELSYQELDKLIVRYCQEKPGIMVTHDAPMTVLHEMFLKGSHKPTIKNRTSIAFDEMFSFRRPDYWIFGHWHETKNSTIMGTAFQCLGIEQIKEYEF